MGTNNKRYCSSELNRIGFGMEICPYCGSSNIKITSISKGADAGSKYQGMCNKCFSRGPIVSDDPYKAAELWNSRAYECKPTTYHVEENQFSKFMSGDIFLNVTSLLEMYTLLNNCSDKFSNYKQFVNNYNWYKYKENTVIESHGSISNPSELWLGYADINYFEYFTTKDIQRIIIIKNK